MREKAWLVGSGKKVEGSGDGMMGRNNGKGRDNSDEEKRSASSHELAKNTAAFTRTKVHKKDSFTVLPKSSAMLIKLSQKNIRHYPTPRLSINGLPTLTTKHSFPLIPSTPNPLITSFITPTIYFLMHEKEKDRYSIQSLPKKLTRQLKSVKVKKVLSL